MKSIAAAIVFITLLFAATTVFSQAEDAPKAQPPAQEPTPEMLWLKQLVGEWDVQFKMFMGPDQPFNEADGSDTVRAVGNHWVVAETKIFNQPFSGILSLGYDTKKKHFVATWIDSMSGHLWTYKGTLNEDRDTLTLETQGPSMQSPDKTARYKEVIRITGNDSRTFTSNMETEDGTWMTILTAEYSRKK
jgi:hypothetical protein